MSDAERRLTMVVAVRIDEASAKLSSGPTDDPDEDHGLAGVVRHGARADSLRRADSRHQRRDGRRDDSGAGVGGAAPGSSVRSLDDAARPDRSDRPGRRTRDALDRGDARATRRGRAIPSPRMNDGPPHGVGLRGLLARDHLAPSPAARHLDPAGWSRRRRRESRGRRRCARRSKRPVSSRATSIRSNSSTSTCIPVRRSRGPTHLHYDLRYVVVGAAARSVAARGREPRGRLVRLRRRRSACEPALAPALAKLARWYATWNVRD